MTQDELAEEAKKLRAKLAMKLSNWLLRTFAPVYSRFVAGAVDYGMCAAVRDIADGREPPKPWTEYLKKEER